MDLKSLILQTCLLFISFDLYGSYYETLPKGRALVGLKNVVISDIKSTYNQDGAVNKLNYSQSFDSVDLEGMDQGLKDYLEQLKSVSERAYDEFSFGEYEIDAKAQANVVGIGLGYGLTDNLTAYVTAAYYDASVLIDIKRTASNNHENVKEILEQEHADETVGSLINQLPDLTGEYLQYVIVDYLGYQPIGNWMATGIGDVELGFIYKVFEKENFGVALKYGVILPTGKIDNPDILQDISFGDGQLDSFIELGQGFSVLSNLLEFESSLRFTYQFGSSKILRIPEDYDVSISEYKALFSEKLGNKIDLSLGLKYNFAKSIYLKSNYQYLFKNSSIYKSPHKLANDILEVDTQEQSHVAKVEFGFSAVDLFLKKQFPLPVIASVSFLDVFAGQNSPNYSRLELDLRMFF